MQKASCFHDSLSSSVLGGQLRGHGMRRPPVLAALPLLFILLLAQAAGRAKAAKQSDIEALKTVGQQLGLPPGVWNLSSDPCSGNWLGVGCCLSNNSNVSPCCSDPSSFYNDLSQTFERCADNSKPGAEISLLFLRSDLTRTTLNGTIHHSICNLSLQLVDIGINRLSGPIPSCLGSVSALQVLRLGDNRLSGTIPPELGSLVSLKQLYLDNLELEGEIPTELANLSALTVLSLRCNKLNGSIPRELGQLLSLTRLELQVNGFVDGFLDRLPRSLTLLSVYNNRLSGRIDPNAFISATALNSLNLRGNSFSGPIPALSLPSLYTLDLGFNQFNGSLPSFSGCPSLTELFVGHNQLNGGVTVSGLPSLGYLDLSHNSFNGSLQPLDQLALSSQINPAFNNFDSSTAPSSLTSGSASKQSFFNCEGPSSPSCVRSSAGKSMYFAVNAGSSAMAPTTQQWIPFDGDTDTTMGVSNSSLGLFYGPRAWAMELSGNGSGTYKAKQTIQGSLPDDELALCGTMRWSSSYIAYHGVGLRPGNYAVSLYFAETVFDRPGYRIFDVRVAGSLVKKDLDVVKEAGAANTAYRLTSNTIVGSNGTVAVELLFVGPDRYLLPGRYDVQTTGPMLSAVSVVSTDYRPSTSTSSGVTVGIVMGSVAAAVSLLIAGVSCWYLRRIVAWLGWYRYVRRRKLSRLSRFQGLRAYTFKELSDATDGFSDKNKLGQGGFGKVYLGTVQGDQIAVKQLMTQTQQSKQSFEKEMEVLRSIQHRNLLALRGYCADTHSLPMLVCDYMQNGSLEKLLHNGQLTWEQRQKIAVDSALGLTYLHEESKVKIVHCDVKPANILLDDEMNPRIGDFGMARLLGEEGKSHVTATRMGGTIGYVAPGEPTPVAAFSAKPSLFAAYAGACIPIPFVAYALNKHSQPIGCITQDACILRPLAACPTLLKCLILAEYAMHYQISDKVDVYSFGVVLLELVSGRRPLQTQGELVLVEWAHSMAAMEQLSVLIDPAMAEDCPTEEAIRMAAIAVHCTQEAPSARPGMRAVWLMLSGTLDVPALPTSTTLGLSTLKALIAAYTRQPSRGTGPTSEQSLLSITPR